MNPQKSKGVKKKAKRISKDTYYLNIAREVAMRGTCLRRYFGAVIVNNDQIISTGYVGAPRKTENCIDIGVCLRDELKVGPGEKYELCRSVHAEQNAILHAARLDMIGGTLYLVGLEHPSKTIVVNAEPCRICKRMIINAGIKKVIIQGGSRIKRIRVSKWIRNNLGEFEKRSGKLIPKIHRGY